MREKRQRFAELANGTEFTFCGFELTKECPHSASGGGKRWFMQPGDLVTPKPVQDLDDDEIFPYFPVLTP